MDVHQQKVTGGVDTWGGTSGSELSSSLTSDTTYSLTCAPYPGLLDSKVVDVNTEPFIKADPRRVPSSGKDVLVEWGTGMEINCAITRNSMPWVPSTTGLGSQSYFVSVNTTFTIDCPIVDQSVKVEVQGYGQET
ncbi:hypothetical protein IPH92_03530 [Candidatus Kaiserbacteria bacterium]|nr:MAG: hypothetical protein IPH92_03530 [Candidatus Kaiserbacteria bacterium]